MLSLEMLGCYSDAPVSQSYPPLLGFFYPKAGNFIGFVSKLRSRRALREVVRAFRSASDFPAESLASPALVPGVSWSDQLSFWREGYRAAMLTDTAFYRCPHYHRATDTPDRLDYARMARVVEGLAGTLAALAGGDTAWRCARPHGQRKWIRCCCSPHRPASARRPPCAAPASGCRSRRCAACAPRKFAAAACARASASSRSMANGA